MSRPIVIVGCRPRRMSAELSAIDVGEFTSALRHEVDADALRRALTCNVRGVASGPLGVLLDLLAGEGT